MGMLDNYGLYQKKDVEIKYVDNIMLRFGWGKKRFGFGQLGVYIDKNGHVKCMNERMARETVRELLHAMADYIADNAEMEDE